MKRLLFTFAALAFLASPLAAQERAVSLPPPVYDPAPASDSPQKLVLAGGCFWGVQGVFQHVKGVSRAVSGYAGGSEKTARYNMVSQSDTGHAESVEITYDPKTVSLGKLLQVYFSVAHDPTQLNRQGPDEGTQYRSAIFISGSEQEKVARDYIAQLSSAAAFASPIVTTLEPLSRFYPAEAYHQDYLVQHPRAPYIIYNDLPKIGNLKKLFPDLYREAPALTN
ncbi:peptide-methionine (S)-S-oxide reductase MsrA [Methylocystis parvus]|uniref:Peptide methionine sulfoxide reductase MsrA n=1 Tax=Methylocystis parvus TaxID=134 RepID=A0A6B8M7Y2_9HYPH|nr:peptide-methionine (S)-S-oxide reductase MsrA [Methylocystis parvus]QGM96850.1 peptide-methionine (S)-S-oxide reductase MsrA [Methylocystis parvus]WBJ99270.1 peptide-methionine (S)-S-oxide reductase MsrA [Methylocystis parvus OBBP]